MHPTDPVSPSGFTFAELQTDPGLVRLDEEFVAKLATNAPLAVK